MENLSVTFCNYKWTILRRYPYFRKPLFKREIHLSKSLEIAEDQRNGGGFGHDRHGDLPVSMGIAIHYNVGIAMP